MTNTMKCFLWSTLLLVAGGLSPAKAQEKPGNIGVLVPNAADLQQSPERNLIVVYDYDGKRGGRREYPSEDCEVNRVDRYGRETKSPSDPRCVVLTTNTVTNKMKRRLVNLEEAEASDRRTMLALVSALSERVDQLEAELKTVNGDLARVRARQAAVLEPEPAPAEAESR